MFCEITRKLEDDDLEKLQSLEKDLGITARRLLLPLARPGA